MSAVGLIPPITEPLGRYWKQPSLDGILIDETHAVMTRRTFDELHEYSRSMPSGVYPGKMWKAIMQDGTALIRWFGAVEGRPDLCSNNAREILIVERGLADKTATPPESKP